MQEKTTSVAEVGLNVHKKKTNILRYNTTCTNQIIIDGEALEGVKTLTYLYSIIDELFGSHADMKVWIGEARSAYLQLKNIWLPQLNTDEYMELNRNNNKKAQ
ncbi:unnamed protein product [Schistosoma curassoni]|uniref:Uncharacterized protein n=1 Tax=Schistosoma curassoni TaxID=6186 RepID=A0A183KYT0_9TREM|nr:unnamed protein product [Schistosoma curassoni]